MDLLALMRHVELFRGLTPEQLKTLSEIFSVEEFSRSSEIFAQGTAGDKMYIIGNGQVEVRVQTSAGESHAVLYLGRGQVVGEMALIDSGKRSAAVIAAEDGTVVYSVPTERFTRLCQENTAIGYIMMRNLAQDLSFKLRHRDYDPSQS